MNKDMIQRLSQYKSVLYRLKSLGFDKVFSENLGDALGVSSSLVRKDFSYFGFKGNKRGGYQIDDLLVKLHSLLGKDEPRHIIIAGCGRIGTALLYYSGFVHEQITVVAGFDNDRDVINPDASIPILHVHAMAQFIREHDITVAVMAVPENATAHVLESLLDGGIRGILNFAPVQLKGTEHCIVHNINLALEIENLFNRIHFSEHQHNLATATDPAE